MLWTIWIPRRIPVYIHEHLLQSECNHNFIDFFDILIFPKIKLTFPFSGMARFIILAILAMGRKRSCSRNGARFDGPSLQESSELSISLLGEGGGKFKQKQRKAHTNLFLQFPPVSRSRRGCQIMDQPPLNCCRVVAGWDPYDLSYFVTQ